MPDLSVFQRFKTKDDFAQAEAEFNLKKQLAQAQINKANELDVDKLGEQAFYKAAQGLELSPQERAAAEYVDAKSGGIQFDPVTGGMIQKPRISDKIGLPGMTPGSNSPAGGSGSLPMPSPGNMFEKYNTIEEIPGGGQMPPKLDVSQLPVLPGDNGAPTVDAGMPVLQSVQQEKWTNPYEQKFQEAMAQAQGNPKLQQSIKNEYLKNKVSPSESELKNQGFAINMAVAEPNLTDPNKIKDGASAWQRTLDVPLVGGFLTSDDYQSNKQAKTQFVNAMLRRESGAAVPPYELKIYDQQYFPQPGEGQDVIAQKALAREQALRGVELGAGAAYQRPPGISYQKDEKAFNDRKAVMVTSEAEALALPPGTRFNLNGRMGTAQ